MYEVKINNKKRTENKVILQQIFKIHEANNSTFLLYFNFYYFYKNCSRCMWRNVKGSSTEGRYGYGWK